MAAFMLLTAGSAWADGRGSSPVLRLDGIGPLRLGMGRADEFDRGALRVMAFSAGVRTTFGVALPGATASDLVKRARAAGYSATSVYDETFAGRFVTVNRGGQQVLGAFATKSAIDTIAVPYVPVCE